jgi:hypothetical protein
LKLSDEEKKEFRALCFQRQHDLKKVQRNRHNPVIINGEVDMDRLLIFLNDCNLFFNHQRKPFRRIIDKDMRL